MSDSWIMRNTGMDKNELLRFKKISGLAELFRDRSFGLSDEWLEELKPLVLQINGSYKKSRNSGLS